MTAAVFDFKAIKAALPSIIEGGDNHYPVAQPMAVDVTEHHFAWEGYGPAVSVDDNGGLVVGPIEGELLGHTCSDGHVWTYDAAESEWFTVNEWGVRSTSFTRPT
jgi:hypothetical protein